MSSAEQRDFGIAVQDALRIDDCLKELWEALAARPRLPGDEQHYYSNFSIRPHDEEAVHNRNSRDLATELIHAGAFQNQLPIWLRLEHNEALADASAFENPDRITWLYGFYRSGRRHAHLEWRPLWVKNSDWRLFLDSQIQERYGDVENQLAPAAAIAWSEDKMRAAIADSKIRNRDRAWREEFKPLRDQHGWDVEAFRLLWPDARGTRGITGRPSKRA